MATVAFTEQALNDINDIADYISHDSLHFARMQAEKIFNRAILLETHPLIGRVVPELSIKSIREVIEGNYRVIYRIVRKDLIHILTVHHSRRLLKRSALKRIIKGSGT